MPYRTPPDGDCGLCSALAIPDGVVQEREHAVLVAALRPRADGAVLVVPRRHVAGFTELTHPELRDVVELVRWATEHLVRAFDPDAVGAAADIGLAAEQAEPHLAVDLIPRYADRPLAWQPYDQVAPATAAQRGALAERLQ